MVFRFPLLRLVNRPSSAAWLFGLLALLGILPFVVLAAYCHPYLDDYSVPIELRKESFLPYVLHTHFRHSGRFSSSLISILHPFVAAGGISLPLYRLYVGGLIVLLAASILLTAQAVLAGGTLGKPVRWLGGCGLVLLFFLWLPNPTEAFYWFISGLAYTVPCVLALALLATISGLLHLTSQPLRVILWVLAGLLCFFTPAFSEITACIALAGVLVTIPALWQARAAWAWWLLPGLALLSALLLLSAPGNFTRMQGMGVSVSPIHALFTTTVAVSYTLVNWLSSGALVLLSILLLPWLHKVAVTQAAPIWQRLTRYWWAWPLLFGAGLYSSFLLTYLATDSPPPARCLNVLYLFFIVCWWMSVFGWVNYRVRQGAPAPQLTGLARNLLGGMIFLSLWSTHDVPLEHLHINRRLNAVVSAYSDWLSGDAARYDQQQQARFRLLTSPQPDVVLPPLTVKLRTIYFRELSTNPHWWGNEDFAACFGKRSLRVAAPADSVR